MEWGTRRGGDSQLASQPAHGMGRTGRRHAPANHIRCRAEHLGRSIRTLHRIRQLFTLASMSIRRAMPDAAHACGRARSCAGSCRNRDEVAPVLEQVRAVRSHVRAVHVAALPVDGVVGHVLARDRVSTSCVRGGIGAGGEEALLPREGPSTPRQPSAVKMPENLRAAHAF